MALKWVITTGLSYIISYHIISFISVDQYRIANPYGYGKWSHQYKVYKTITIYGI